MASIKPKQLDVPQIDKIHLQLPEVGKALDTMVQFIRKNVTPLQGNKKNPPKYP